MGVTLHAYDPPVVVAHQYVTVDHIIEERFELILVMSCFTPDMRIWALSTTTIPAILIAPQLLGVVKRFGPRLSLRNQQVVGSNLTVVPGFSMDFWPYNRGPKFTCRRQTPNSWLHDFPHGRPASSVRPNAISPANKESS
jgi:hypothetical protein